MADKLPDPWRLMRSGVPIIRLGGRVEWPGQLGQPVAAGGQVERPGHVGRPVAVGSRGAGMFPLGMIERPALAAGRLRRPWWLAGGPAAGKPFPLGKIGQWPVAFKPAAVAAGKLRSARSQSASKRDRASAFRFDPFDP